MLHQAPFSAAIDFTRRFVLRAPVFGLALAVAALVVQPVAAQQKKPKIPDPEDVTLDSKDGWKLDATYYQGTAGKKAVPIIMVHGWGGRRGEYDALARALQRPELGGHSSLSLDLRGHGGSVRYRTAAGLEKEIDYEDLSKMDIGRMVYDIEAAKNFLLAKNNAGECNIEQLCVVAADMGGIVALNWAAKMDLYGRRLLTRSAESGFNVKAMILLSPEQTFKGISAVQALQNPLLREKLSLMILAGNQDARAFSDAKRLYKAFDRYRPDLESPEDKAKYQDLFLPSGDGDGIETSVQGTKLLQTPPNLRVGQYILAFINARLLQYADDFPWTERSAGGS